MLENNKPRPLYDQLKTILRQDIMRGVYLRGDKLPSEQELCEQYGVSRVTVRRAIHELCRDGYLQSRQGKGTFCSYGHHKIALHGSFGFSRTMHDLGLRGGRKLLQLRLDTPAEDISSGLQLKKGMQTVYIRRLLTENNEPLMIDDSWFSHDYFPDLLNIVDSETSFYDLIQNYYRFKIDTIHKEFSVAYATDDDAHSLGCEPGDALLSINKISFIKNRPVWFSRILALPSRVTYVLDAHGDSDRNPLMQVDIH